MSATLAEVIGGAGEPLRWMVLTWDTAGIEGSTSQYNRFYLADDSFLASSGRRSPKVFAAIPKPLAGAYAGSSLRTGGAVEAALQLTDLRISLGNHLVCRPLAVDCSAFAGGDATDAGDLLQQLEEKTDLGFALLSYLNAARLRARETHLDPGWAEHFPGYDPEALWTGQ